MAELLPDADEQALQHFISNATWDARGVMDQVACEADQSLGGHDDTMLLIDDSGFPKKGVNSVGVSRQYCGQTGKLDNCQVGVFAALCHGTRATLIDARLFVPSSWTSKPDRCAKAGIPPEAPIEQTKHDLARATIQHALELGIRFRFLGFDAGYGESGVLLRDLDRQGLRFFADVHKTQYIYLEDPSQAPHARPLTVEQWVSSQPESAWKSVTLREATRGPLVVQILHQRVWFKWGDARSSRQWHLLVRREVASPKEIKYTASNAPADLSRQRLAYLQGQRYWVERCFEDAKQQVGMGDYQVRGWGGWHHHMAMVLMGMLFLLEAKQSLGEDLPVTSADIEWLLCRMLPTRGHSDDEILDLLLRRIRKRTAGAATTPPNVTK